MVTTQTLIATILGDTTMEYLSYWPHVLVGVASALWIRGNKLAKRVAVLEQEPTAVSVLENKAGMVRITEEAIAALRRANPEQYGTGLFPQDLRKYIQVIRYKDIARWLTEDLSDDARRAITVAAIRFKITIPKALMCLDVVTLQFWDRLRAELTLVNVNKEELLVAIRNKPVSNIRNPPVSFKDVYPIVVETVAAFNMRGTFGCLDPVAEAIRKSVKGSQADAIDHDVVMSLATVVAINTGMRIPVSYVSFSKLTHAILQEINNEELDFAPFLRVVK